MNSLIIHCPCCGSLLTVTSDGIYTYSVPENPMASINNAAFASQIFQQQSIINSQIAQQNSIASNQIAQHNSYYGMSNLINTVRQMEASNDN